VTPVNILLPHGWSAKPHHPVLSVLDVALQAAIQVLYHAHPELDCDEPAPFDDDAPADLLLADIVVTSARALLDALRHYRTVQQNNIDF
jgi:hypothetical protein